MTMFLGIDGGGTGCRAALADAAGHVLATATAGPANIASDPEGALRNILDAAGQALAQVVGADRVAAEMSLLHAGLGLAGAHAAGAAGRLIPALPFAQSRIETDAVAAAKGALGAADGVVAAIGTGSVFAQQRAGRIRHIGGWGLVLGDEASGAWLGRAILSQALRAVDGLAEMTPLLSALIDAQGGPAEFATLAPQVVASQDPAARAVMALACDHVAESVAALRVSDDMPVVFIGGLGAVFADRLAGRWPVQAARGTALDGALHLAREGV